MDPEDSARSVWVLPPALHAEYSQLRARQEAQKLGIPNVSGETFPFFNIGYRMTSMGQEAQVGEDLTFQNNFTQIIGSHTLKMGYELMRTRYNAVLPALPGGTYNFSGTDAPFTANTGNTFASFLLGTAGSGHSQNFASWLPRWWQHAVSAGRLEGNALPASLSTVNFETPYQTENGQQSST